MGALTAALGSMISNFFVPRWLEILFCLFFALGYTALWNHAWKKKPKKIEVEDDDGDEVEEERFFRSEQHIKTEESRQSNRQQMGKSNSEYSICNEKKQSLYKLIEADVEAGKYSAALESWHSVKSCGPAPIETIRVVLRAYLEVEPDQLASEVVEHFTVQCANVHNSSKSTNVVLDAVAVAGRIDILEKLTRDFETKLQIKPTVATYEILLGAHAAAGDESRVMELLSDAQKYGHKMSAKGYSVTIKGFLKKGIVHAALTQVVSMKKKGLIVPSFAPVQLFNTACQKGCGVEIFEALAAERLDIPQDASVVLLEDCCKKNDLELAHRIENIVRDTRRPLPRDAYDSLLKIYVTHADNHALQIFKNMQKEGIDISEDLCVGLLGRCADSKFLHFAEDIVEFARKQHKMTIACYSALMKVYAYADMYDKACDLYAQIRSEGLEPDSLMYGCLMKLAVECGRTELSNELFQKAPSVDMQNYLTLIRTAGKDKDVPRAFAVLEKLKTAGDIVDISAYNSVLDVCIAAGEIQRAKVLFTEMKQTVSPDIVSYNTLLKVYCTTSDPAGAKDLLLHMDKAGIAPNDVSYNCIINAAMSSGNFEEVWNAVDLMEKNGFTPDQYTVSILMRGLKKVKDVKDSTDVIRALKLLDRSSVDVCSDETLLNNVLETCTRHRQVNCLGKTVASFLDSNLKPSLHTYCSLIKAASKAQSCGNAQKLWNAMVYERGMQPNDVTLGCMLDALVNNDKVEEAVSLLNKWKASIPPTTDMYCTLIRGFANDKQPQRALDMWKEMNSMKLPPNTVVFNALIDAQAQVGAMDEVAKLVQSMEPNGISPDVLTFSSIAKGYCCKGDVQKAFDVFRSMQRRGMAIDSIVYNTIMDAAMRHNRIDLVDMALEDMEKNNVVPSNFTLGILVKVYGQQHRLDKAFKIIEELPQKHGIKVNTQVRTCLMCACLNNHDIDRAMKVFEDIKGASAGVDAKTYSSLIAGLVRIGAPEKGIAVVDQAYGLVGKRGLTAGQNLDSECLEQLVQALGKSKETKAMGCKLVDRMRSAGVPISGKLVVLSGRM